MRRLFLSGQRPVAIAPAKCDDGAQQQTPQNPGEAAKISVFAAFSFSRALRKELMKHGTVAAGCKEGSEEAEKHEEVSPGPDRIRRQRIVRPAHEEAVCRRRSGQARTSIPIAQNAGRTANIPS
jgi:hypothetical protein